MTIDEMIKKYGIKLVTSGENAGKLQVNYPPKDKMIIDQLRNKKQEIIDFIQIKENERKEHYKKKELLISQIEGLSEIEAAMDALDEWKEAFDKSFEEVGGIGIGEKPEYDFNSAYEKYPRAAAYLKAKNYYEKENYELSRIGNKAIEEVVFGDYKKAMDEMEKELKDFSEKHAWE